MSQSPCITTLASGPTSESPSHAASNVISTRILIIEKLLVLRGRADLESKERFVAVATLRGG
jgi:hypothetical protein